MDLVQRALEFALRAYGSEDKLIHPREVRELVAAAGADEEVQAAAILHDLVEDTDADMQSVEAEFGPRVRDLVAAMTEDPSIDDYIPRKAEARQRACASGPDTALVFVADKLSNTRRMQRGQKKPDRKKIGHYAATLEIMRASYPDLPLLDELESELEHVRAGLESSSPA